MRIGIPRKMRLETAAGTTTQGCYNVVFGRHYSGALSRSIDVRIFPNFPISTSHVSMAASNSDIQNDDRARLSRLWVPTGGIATPLDEGSSFDYPVLVTFTHPQPRFSIQARSSWLSAASQSLSSGSFAQFIDI